MTNTLAKAFFDLDNLFPASNGGFPYFDIIRMDRSRYAVVLAVAGFSREDLEVTVADGVLKVAGNRSTLESDDCDGDKDEPQYIHRGITRRSFQRTFRMAENMRVTGSDLRNGELTVYLKREEPERAEPLRIEIKD